MFEVAFSEPDEVINTWPGGSGSSRCSLRDIIFLRTKA